MKTFVFLGLLLVVVGKPATNVDPMQNADLFEGDILGIDPNVDRNAVPLDSQRWPRGVVPYIISSDLASMKDVISRAMRHIEDKSCIRFVRRSNEPDYVNIFRGSGCYSNFGRIGGGQELSLGYQCDNFAVVVHELMHALGFAHEHNRSDRDDYIMILWHNIDKKWHDVFTKLKSWENRLLTPFAYNSIMLYGSNWYTKNPGQYSMISKDGKPLQDLYDKKSMSPDDAFRIKALYNCP